MGRKPKNPEAAAKVNVNMIIDPTGEKADKTKLGICRRHPDCFSCVEGYCTALHARYVGKDCSFYKTGEQGIKENRETYERLLKNGRYDILDEYGATLASLGVFDLEMTRADQMAQEMEKFRQASLEASTSLEAAVSLEATTEKGAVT